MRDFVVGNLGGATALAFWAIVGVHIAAGAAVGHQFDNATLWAIGAGVYGLLIAMLVTGITYVLLAQLEQSKATNNRLSKILLTLEGQNKPKATEG
ncbi:MAG: hypothetical protein II007_04555 [Gammaproteobacteria bacterium]|nr:hypothetical protein [Gammaproteobacteria bacterium]